MNKNFGKWLIKKDVLLTVGGVLICIVGKMIEQRQKEEQIKAEVKKLVDEHFELEEEP